MMRDRILGSLLGGVVADAFGNPFEGKPPPVTATAATCRAIADARGKVDPEKIAAVFADWFRRGKLTGLGASTTKALRDLVAGGHWALVGAKGENAGGNGAAMRIAPVAFAVDPSTPAGRRTIRDISRITHHHEEAYAGALAIAFAIHAPKIGSWTGGPGLIDLVASSIPDSRVRDRMLELAKTTAEFSSEGASGFAGEFRAIEEFAGS